MALMDEYKKERESIKSASFSKKWEYFWEYYKIHVFVLLFIAILVGMFVHSFATKKEAAFHAVFLNSKASLDEINEVKARYMEKMELDTEIYDVFLDNTMYFDYEKPESIDMNQQQKLSTLLLTGELDAVASEGATLGHLAYSNFFMDMRKVLTPEQVTRYEDQFFYIDGSILKVVNEMNDNIELEQKLPKYVYGSAEGMTDPIPVAIQADSEDSLYVDFVFNGTEAVIGIPVTTDNVESSIAFIEMVIE